MVLLDVTVWLVVYCLLCVMLLALCTVWCWVLVVWCMMCSGLCVMPCCVLRFGLSFGRDTCLFRLFYLYGNWFRFFGAVLGLYHLYWTSEQ